jgi:tetratricopeptide (TPR) repeat protein
MKIKNQRWFLAMFLLLAPLAGLAEDSPDKTAEAKSFYEAGKAHFQEGRYEEAMKAFTESYNLSNEPNLLYNLGATAEHLGDVDRAVAYYEVYLEELPGAPDAEEVRMRVERLKARPPAESPRPADQTPAEEETPAKAEEAPGEQQTSAEDYYNLNADQDEGKVKVFWPGVVLGIGGLLVAGGTITGIMAYKDYQDLETNCSPNCADDETDTTRGLALATDLQFAFGAVAVVAGTIMWIAHVKNREARASGSLSAAPVALTGGGGLVVVGRF